MDQMEFDTGFRLIFESLLSGVHTAFPAKVESYDPLTMRCEIQPCLKRKYPNSDPSNLPKIVDVPVLFPSSGKFSVVFALESGSYVLCICSERALDQWLTMGGIVDPLDPRKFEITDAVAIPGLFPLPNILVPPHSADGLEIRNLDGTSILKLTDSELMLQCGSLAVPPVDYAVKYDQLKIAFDALKQSFNTHVHLYIPGPSGSASTATPTAPATADMSLAKVANVRLPE